MSRNVFGTGTATLDISLKGLTPNELRVRKAA